MSAADVAFARALERWQAGSLREAHAACLDALGHAEGHLAAAVLASEILLRVGEAGRGVALLADVVRRAPEDGAVRLLLARAQRTSGEFRAAERSAAAARRLSPSSAEAAAEHALALIALGREDEAAAALERSAAAAGEDAQAHWVVADTLLRLRAPAQHDDRLARAREAFAQAVALDRAAATWHGAEALRHAGGNRRDEADGLIARGRQLMPQDPELAHMAAAARGDAPDRASGAYVAAHFDAFADSFDGVLVGRLGYRLPELICEALERHFPGAPLGVVLDAGCGTGLCAARLRPLARRLVGVDLSPRMVTRARELGLYDELAVADLSTWLAQEARAASYMARVAAEAGFEELESSEVAYRVEGGEPVGSTIVCLRLAPPP